MKSDPYNIDQSQFAQVLRDMQEVPVNEDLDDLDEPPHPLGENPHVTALCDYIRSTHNELFELRKPGGGMGEDAYFRFNEGLELRPEVLVTIMIDYIKQHPEIISE